MNDINPVPLDENSPAPGTPQTPTKAYVALVVAFIAAFGTSLLTVWTDSDPLSTRDFVVALVFALVGSGITGGAVFTVQNKPTV